MHEYFDLDELTPEAAALVQEAEKNYDERHETVRSDPDYPALHLAPPVGRLNDPNGLVYQDGIYHAFYQYSPVHPTRAVFWRHATSTDLTSWTDRGSVIAPVEWYDKNGCYSGSGIVSPEGNLEFFYTGNVKDAEGNRSAYQALFTSEDQGQSFQRYEQNPLITSPLPDSGYTAHYRDPHVFEREGLWWAVIGAQRTDETGAIVVYTSFDRRRWDFAGEIDFSDPALKDLGYMYECPNLIFQKDEATGSEKAILIFSPQGMEAEGEKYNNIYQTGYVVGTLQGLHFEVETPFTELDSGTEFYAPQVFSNRRTEQGEHIMLGWFGNAEQDDQPSWEKHWVHQFTYPRALSLRNGKVYQRPVAQLDEVLPLRPAEVGEGGVLPALNDARVFRLAATVDVSAGPVTLSIEDEQGLALRLTVGADSAGLDRSGTRYHAGGDLRTRSLPPAQQRRFELLVDASGTEFFVDGGTEVFSSRTFFTGSARRVRIQGSAVKSSAVLEPRLAVLPE